MKQKLSDLKILHNESVRLNKERMKINCQFYEKLSVYKNLKDFLVNTNEIKSDNKRAEFLCILFKEKFIKNNGKSFKFHPKSLKAIWEFQENQDFWAEFHFDQNKKNVELYCSFLSWDSLTFEYTFDCISTASLTFLNKKNIGEVTYEPEESERSKGVLEFDDLRMIIDSIFVHCKKSIKIE